jgi:hypothetical protein
LPLAVTSASDRLIADNGRCRSSNARRNARVDTLNGSIGQRLLAALRQVQADLPDILQQNFNEQIFLMF